VDLSSPAIEAVKVSRRMGRIWALIDVDLRLARGSALLLAGRNGAGKSTFLRVAAGALHPDRGDIRAHGEAGRDALRRRTALLSHASYCYEALSAIENLRVAARLMGRPAGRPELLAALARVALDHRADSPVQTFSAGMRKRLSIARVVLQNPDVLLLDEPYGQLDPPGFAMVDQLVADAKARGATVVMASHQLVRASAICDRGVVLDRGRVAWSGPSRDLPAQGGLQE
jgi:heme exporter protein A